MKNKLVFFLLCGLVFTTCSITTNATLSIDDYIETGYVDAVPALVPFSKGVNFSGWFETSNAQRITFTQYDEQDFANARSLGADVIRLPVRLHDMTSGEPDYTLDPFLLRFLDLAVDWAEKYQIYLIIDNHSFHPVDPTTDDIDKVLLPVWAQVAQRYKDRPYVIYEILNEPHGISDRRWGEVQGMAIDTIRKYDQKTPIIVGGTDYNSYNKLSALPHYTDPNIIYTFHYYDPFLFTHQGASWTPPFEYITGVPFPADKSRMPKVPLKIRGTWAENTMRNYPKDAAPLKLFEVLDKVVAFSKERNVPVFCGEFGVYMQSSPPEDRVLWYEFAANALNKRNIPRTSWDYYGGFGVFNFEGKGDFHSDLNTGVVRAMGFTPPVQTTRPVEPLRTGFTLFDDYPSREISSGFWGDEDTDFSFYETNAAEGEFAIRWDNAGQYNAFFFGFRRNGDFSELVKAGYCIEFLARTEKPVSFAVRFLNPENPTSTPWRIAYTIDEKNLPPDGRWHTIRIPFMDMHEHGAWVNMEQKWLNPRNEFTWKDIERLEFAAEHMNLKGYSIWFDNIKITEY
ncbi:MAG: glycoside hydrolase family 5 protein [Treponema sp.]|jgi:endoglucanase|nr:glycoside hydrolase family 5 protein [Treponema sp.]